ncbi:MAG: rRNA adenine methyltransferase [Bacteroidetes bacterium]|nr:rRNA adenine methyltransferase [Bacteroidota bacterium]
MHFDPENPIVKLCAQGMLLEGEAKHAEAAALFDKAWADASDDQEKFIAAHYVARHQNNVNDKLTWDETALYFALRIKDEGVKETLPSLYLNIAKCFEDLHDAGNALKNYELALDYTRFLPDNGYSNMIRAGIGNGMKRVLES